MFKGIFVRYKVTIAFCVLVIVLLLIRVWRPHEEVVFDRSQGQDAQPVHTLVVSPSKFADEVITTGTLRAYENIDLQVEVPGKLVYIGFVEGAEVARGTLLLRVDDSELQAELRRTERRRDLAALSERRLAPLVAAGGISESQYDEAATQLSILDAEVDLVRQQLARRVVHAPFDGVVGLRFVSEGSYVTPSTRIATFQYTGKMKLDFSLPERFGATVAPGQLVQFTVVGIERTFEASIYAVEPRIDEVTRTLTVRAVLENHDYSLRPGAFARVRWTAEAEQSAIFIPSVALLPATDGDAVFIVRDGVVARRAVVSGPRSAEQIRILSGLNQGDEVIIAGVQQVRPGMLVVKINN